MRGKNVLITGGTSGIGKATAIELAARGANVIIVGRNREKTLQVVIELKSINNTSIIDYFVADLSSMESVRKLADEFKAKYGKLNVLINNAGLIIGERWITADGYEYTLALDYLSPFLLTGLLTDVLRAGQPSRIIMVNSAMHLLGKIRFDDLMIKKGYTANKAYCQAKLANMLFTYELSSRLKGMKVTVNALNPGAVRTNFGNDLKGIYRSLIQLAQPLMISPEKGAETVVYLASSSEVEGITGKYFIMKKQVKSSKQSYNKDMAKRLWDESEKLTAFKYSL
jgi:NAD(P)-dependent dehydrogenase (short-subunit alcohol dehydrogenase family)